MGRYVLAQDYLLALEAKDTLRREVDDALAGCDALLLPSLPIPAQPIGADTVQVDGTPQAVRAMMLRLTQLFNLSGHPALSLPCGWNAEGLPSSLQIVGRRFETAALLAVGAGCEAAMAGRVAPPGH
jgi:aspartyl-tRNA(Asn)/glutamyl-tRNA(Gln) amidotransferase subunit A